MNTTSSSSSSLPPIPACIIESIDKMQMHIDDIRKNLEMLQIIKALHYRWKYIKNPNTAAYLDSIDYMDKIDKILS